MGAMTLPTFRQGALALAVGGAGWLAAGSGPLALAWLALAAAPIGALAAPPRGESVWPALLAAGVLVGPLVFSGDFLAAWVVIGLFLLGAAASVEGAKVPSAAMCLVVGTALAMAPAWAGAAGHAPFPSETTARLLDLSPVVLVVESAGVDWLRHPAVYGPAGGDAIGPDLWTPPKGALAGSALVLVGCALLAARTLFARRSGTLPS